MELGNADKVYTEKDWNPLTYEEGKAATAPMVAYGLFPFQAPKQPWPY